MRRLVTLFIIGIMTAATAVADNTTQRAVAANDDDSIFVAEALMEARLLPRTTNFPLHFARKFLGRPYVAYTLEGNDPERLVVNTRQLDCTTLVENVTALTLCVYRNLYTWRDYLNALLQMR